MAFVPTPDVAHVKIIGQLDNQQTVNDLYFVSTAPPISQFTLASLAAGIGAWAAGDYAPLLPETWAGVEVAARDLTSQFSFVATDSLAGTTGGISGEQAPNNVTANLTLRTGLAGRNNHGANRIPGIPNSLIDVNVIDAAHLGAWVAAYSLLIAGGGSTPAGWTWVVLSQFSGFTIVDGKKVPTPRVEGVYHEIFSVIFTDNIVDSQKTRLPKHGK